MPVETATAAAPNGADEFAAERAIVRARRLQPHLHAFTEILPEPVSGQPGPLGGMPYAAKDLVETEGRAPTLGLASVPDAVTTKTASVIERLGAHGGRLIGFTAMTALAYEPSGENAEWGRPANPWSIDHICGGSSSGSAVAVAAGIVPLALGSDTAGSLRIPAHCCGVTAWKPTRDLIPADGAMALAPSLDTLGFLAHAAADLMRVAGIFDLAATGVNRVAIALDVLADCDPCIVSAVARIEPVLRWHRIEIGDSALNHLIGCCDAPVLTLLSAEAALTHRARLDSGELPPMLALRLDKGRAIDAAQMQRARTTLAEIGETVLQAAFGDADAIVLPVMRMSTPKVARCEPGSPAFSGRVLYELSALTRWVNGLGLPAVAIPAGFDRDGLPIAVQIVARPRHDRALLQLAAAIQSHTDWHGRLPTGVRGFAGEFA